MSFRDIKGHNFQIKTLIDSVSMDKVSSAYLFLGPSGIGKRSVAINFAKFLNCQNITKGATNPCDHCQTCKKIDNLQHPDVFLIMPDSTNTIKIDCIRDIEKRACLKPYEAKYKIFIIDDAEDMTEEAANALLKTLEEPEKDTVFVLIATQEKKLPSTIVSRCQRIKFNTLGLGKIKAILIKDYHLDEKKAHFISYFSEGKVAVAFKFKDENILKEKNTLINDFIYKRIAFKDRDDAKNGLNLFLSWLRDLLLIKIGYNDSALINLDRKSELIKNKDRYTIIQLENSISFISDAMTYLQKNINIRLLNNLVKIKLCKG